MALWLTTDEADTYFTTRFGADKYWAVSTPKTAVLTTAQSYLETAGIYTFPDPPTDAMKNAVCEQGLFLLRDPDGLEARASLQSQGVVQADIVGETYSGSRPGHMIAPLAHQLLAGLVTAGRSAFEVER